MSRSHGRSNAIRYPQVATPGGSVFSGRVKVVKTETLKPLVYMEVRRWPDASDTCLEYTW